MTVTKIISLALMAVMLVGFNITVFAAEESSISFDTYTCNVGYPATQIIDSGRTLTVTAYGTFDNYFAEVMKIISVIILTF